MRLKAFVMGAFIGACIIICIIFIAFLVTYKNKIIPGVFIGNISVGGKTSDEAERIVLSAASARDASIIAFLDEKVRFSTASSTLGFYPNTHKVVENAYLLGRNSSLAQNFSTILKTLLHPTIIPPEYLANNLAIQLWVSSLAKQIDIQEKNPSVSLGKSGNTSSLLIDPGKSGRTLDQKHLADEIAHIKDTEDHVFKLSIASTSAQLSKNEIKEGYARASKIVGVSLLLKGDDISISLNDQNLVAFLTLPGGYNEISLRKKIQSISIKVNRPPQNPEFEMKDGKVIKFSPPLNGHVLNTESALRQIISTLQSIENGIKTNRNIDLDIALAKPEVSLGDTNALGINEKIGEAESLFFHSIPNRVYNVSLTSRRLNNTLVPPGKAFSFNNTIGEVSNLTGYKQAYIISEGKTILGDGGGVCQVSTTMFRAALNTGLKILERRGHSYRVGYYEQNAKPGIDATVYSPSTDLKILNDTPGYILITTDVDPANYHLTIKVWGTSDGRKAEILDQKIWDQVPALPTRYQDDPTLPLGTVKQVDFSAPGAKTSFNYKVTRGEQTLEDVVFNTTYQPWAAVYLRGTATN